VRMQMSQCFMAINVHTGDQRAPTTEAGLRVRSPIGGHSCQHLQLWFVFYATFRFIGSAETLSACHLSEHGMSALAV
jgi:hypothetical protein